RCAREVGTAAPPDEERCAHRVRRPPYREGNALERLNERHRVEPVISCMPGERVPHPEWTIDLQHDSHDPAHHELRCCRTSDVVQRRLELDRTSAASGLQNAERNSDDDRLGLERRQWISISGARLDRHPTATPPYSCHDHVETNSIADGSRECVDNASITVDDAPNPALANVFARTAALGKGTFADA